MVGDVHPEIGRLVPVDEDLEFRLAHLEGGVHIDDPRHFGKLAGDLLGVGLDRREIGPPDAVLDRHLPLPAADHGEILRRHLETGKLSQLLADLLLQIHLGLLPFALRDEAGHHDRPVDRAADAQPVVDRPDLRHLSHDLLRRPEELIRLVQRIVDGRLQTDDELPLVLRRDELLPHECRHSRGCRQRGRGPRSASSARWFSEKSQDAAVAPSSFL